MSIKTGLCRKGEILFQFKDQPIERRGDFQHETIQPQDVIGNADTELKINEEALTKKALDLSSDSLMLDAYRDRAGAVYGADCCYECAFSHSHNVDHLRNAFL